MTDAIKRGLVQRITRNLLDVQMLRLIQVRPMWGYMIKKEVEARFNVRIRHGALYPMLKSMEDKGLLASEMQKHGGRVRKIYSLTEKGAEYVEVYVRILKEQIKKQDISGKGAA